MAPFCPAHVDADRKQQHEADDHRRGAALEPEPDKAVGQKRDDDRSDHRLTDRAAPAAYTVAAQKRGGHHGEFEPEAGVGASAGKRAA